MKKTGENKQKQDANELSPMMQQYYEIKAQYPDSVLFFRLGDFYEMFFEDAEEISEKLGLRLTGRASGAGERAPMCGVPYHSCEAYLQRLVSMGYKIAICEQMEDPSLAKGLVKRQVIRVITPGTVLEEKMLEEDVNNYLCTVCLRGRTAGLCFVDASTGALHLTEVTGDKLEQRIINTVSRFMPREVLLNGEAGKLCELSHFLKEKLCCRADCMDEQVFSAAAAAQIIGRHFGGKTPQELELPPDGADTAALGCAIRYLYDTCKNGLDGIRHIDRFTDAEFVRMDLTARRNLELLQTMRNGERRGSLLWVLDKTKTAMGKRLIREWIEQPLLHPPQIIKRLNAVEELVNATVLREELINLMAGIRDMERPMTRVVYGSVDGRELRSIADTIACLPPLKKQLGEARSLLLKTLCGQIDPLEDIHGLITASISEDAPNTIREGGVIKKGYDPEIDALRDEYENSGESMAGIELRERERTGIPKLKVGYNKVFGYFIEVSNIHKDKVPEDYIRKQTLTNCERYITPELKQLEQRVLGAEEKLKQMEYEAFCRIRGQVAAAQERFQRTAAAVAALDVLCSFARAAADNGYCRPNVTLGESIRIEGGRHPVVEAISRNPFVPNDTLLDEEDNRCAIITGPNMAGKSTYMRQVALITLMAQIGSFVPASAADIGVVDAIYTRVGASDDLAAGQSTFMVEMSEVAFILKDATRRSLLILDEIGRGTSTYDGMAIARAVLEYCADK
ncbi:MAG: DNA mismatch repair protein MutS, partial [Clostridiales bacterium]|nr:DNA mismatch repair protein MutS [Clostridiales bacterium]